MPCRAPSSYTQSVHPMASLDAGRPAAQLLSVDQFRANRPRPCSALADMMQPIARRQKITRVLEGAVLANLFFEASTRTRVSFGAAFCRLGGSVCDTTGFTFSSMAKGESIYDTSRVISGYADAIVVRHPEQGSVAEFARATNMPVINAGDGPASIRARRCSISTRSSASSRGSARSSTARISRWSATSSTAAPCIRSPSCCRCTRD